MKTPISVDGIKEYQFLAKIGEGSFSNVFKVQHKKTRKLFALKVMRERYRSIDQVQKCDEIQVMLKLGSHPNIVAIHDVIFEPIHARLSFSMDLMDMNLLDMMQNKSIAINVPVALKLTCQMLRALAHMHAHQLIHRDIKPENCLVNPKTMELKLADFGSTHAVMNNVNLTEYIATRWYRPPEVLLTSGEYGTPLDIWAVGCVLFELITRRPLFPGRDTLDQLQKIHQVLGTPDNEMLMKFRISRNMKNRLSFQPSQGTGMKTLLPNVDENVLDLLSKMLVYLPDQRITAQEALNHPAFAGIPPMERLPILSDTVKSAPATNLNTGKEKPKHTFMEATNDQRRAGVRLPRIQYVKPVNQPRAPVRTVYGQRRGIISSKPAARAALAPIQVVHLRV